MVAFVNGSASNTLASVRFSCVIALQSAEFYLFIDCFYLSQNFWLEIFQRMYKQTKEVIRSADDDDDDDDNNDDDTTTIGS